MAPNPLQPLFGWGPHRLAGQSRLRLIPPIVCDHRTTALRAPARILQATQGYMGFDVVLYSRYLARPPVASLALGLVRGTEEWLLGLQLGPGCRKDMLHPRIEVVLVKVVARSEHCWAKLPCWASPVKYVIFVLALAFLSWLETKDKLFLVVMPI